MGWLFGESRDGFGAEERAISNLPWIADTNWANGGGIDGALSLVPVYGAVRLISESIAGTPVKAYRKLSDDSRQQIARPAFLDGPPGELSPVWIQKAMVSLLLRGNAYGLKSGFGVAGEPTAIRWLNPDRISYNEVDDVFLYDGRPIREDELLHIPGLSVPGKRLGVTPITACAAMVDAGKAMQVTARDTYRNRRVPSLKMRNTAKTLKAKEAEAVKARLKSHIRAGEPLVLGSDWDVTTLAPSMEDVSFVMAMKATATQVAVMFGIPPEDIGGEVGGSLTYSTTEANEIRFNTRTLQPWVSRLEAAFTSLLPRPQYVRFNLDARIRVDARTRWDIHQVSRTIGARNIDEVRAIEDEPPLPNGEGQDYSPLKGTSPAPAPQENQ